MAVAAAAALLDELMGRSRNDFGLVKKKIIRWDDPEYCKYYMVNFCPHDLFVNTKADLGPCPKVHCDEAKSQYMNAEGPLKVQYEEDFLRFAQSMLNDVERKIIKGEQRLALMGKSEPPQKLSTAETKKNDQQIALLNEKINNLVNEAEQMGIQGNVEEAQGLMKLCDQLKEERESLLKQNENSNWSSTVEIAVAQEKQMEVCKVCGAFLIVGDAQSRIDDHLMGKQHTGYGRLKNAVEEITKRREEELIQKDKKREEERNKRGMDREAREKKHSERSSRSPRRTERHDYRSRDDRYSSSRDRTRDRRDRTNNEPDRRSRDRIRDRSRDRSRRRSKETNKDRYHRSKERDRDRQRDKYRSHRSDSYHSSRSKSREKSRSKRHSSRDKRSHDKDSKYRESSDKDKHKKEEKKVNGHNDDHYRK